VLGAGFGTLGYRRAPEFPDAGFFEIDHPDTSRLKSKAIARLGGPSNLHLIGEDLGERRLSAVLAVNEAWNRRESSIIVAERLLICLPPPATSDLLGQCAEVTGAGSRVAFTYLDRGADGRPAVGRWTGLVVWLFKVGGEPWLWSIQPDELAPFLADAGWTSAPELAGSLDKRGGEHYRVAVR
jgi:methyltransferase (TIGR00027 family)